jgi:hypothetical protein
MEVAGYFIDKQMVCEVCTAFLGYDTSQPIFTIAAREYNIQCAVCGEPLVAKVVELAR